MLQRLVASSCRPHRRTALGGCLGLGAGVALGLQQHASHAESSYASQLAPGTIAYPDVAKSEGWVSNWDGREAPAEASESLKKRLRRAPTRHLLLVRHGQYDLKSTSDPPLTELGRKQALITGQYLAKWAVTEFKASPRDTASVIKMKDVHTSDVLRARQTGEIIAQELGLSLLRDADPLLAEGAPCPTPGWEPYPSTMFEDGARIEAAYRKYFHRSVDGYRAWKKETAAAAKAVKVAKKAAEAAEAAPALQGTASAGGQTTTRLADGTWRMVQSASEGADAEAPPAAQVQAPEAAEKSYEGEESYELVVCHGNVIRYFMLRALQLRPDAWLRLATYNCGVTHLVIRPNGKVSLMGFGDVGHLSLDERTYH